MMIRLQMINKQKLAIAKLTSFPTNRYACTVAYYGVKQRKDQMYEMRRQSALLEKVEAWLFSQGCSELWLTTDLDKRLRAYSFYKKHGWSDW